MTDQPSRRRLDSWKEIAAFLGRDMRTVQRWEHEGLPVHRRPGARRSSVFAYPDEIENWLSGRPASGLQEAAGPDTPRMPDARPAHRRSRLFAAAAALLAAATATLIWVARADGPRSPTEKPLAVSTGPLHGPQWADFNDDGGDDLLISTNRSPTLLFFGAAAKRCGAIQAIECADVRLTLPEACYGYARAGDFNADGIDDLAISCVLREPESYSATGPTYLVWGRPSWPRDLRLPEDAAVTISTAAAHDDRVHVCLASPGRADLDADGIDDVLIGGGEAPFMGRLSAGALYVFRGRRDWQPAMDVGQADITVGGTKMGDGIGGLCAVGDVDGDSLPELATVAPETPLWNLLGGGGRLYVLRGRRNWPAHLDLSIEAAMEIAAPPAGHDRRSLQLILADVTGDARDEIIFGLQDLAPGVTPAGRLAIWHGKPFRSGRLTFDQADTLIDGRFDGRLGTALAGADFDLDRAKEVLVSEPGHGAVWTVGREALASRRARPTQALLDDTSGWERALGEDGGLAASRQALAQVTIESGKLWKLWVRDPFIPIQVDVRPGTNNDVIVRPGVTAIAIDGGASVHDIVPESLRASGAAPIAIGAQDVNHDGRLDLVGRFRVEDMQLPPDASRLTLTGRTRRGQFVRGESPVRVVPAEARGGK